MNAKYSGTPYLQLKPAANADTFSAGILQGCGTAVVF